MNMKNIYLLIVMLFPAMIYGHSAGTIMQIQKISALQENIPLNVIQAGDHFGCSIDTIGDINNDGVNDLAIDVLK